MADLKDVPGQAYGFWNQAGAWVADHPKTTTVIAFVVLVSIAALLGLH
jgi:uncharacterized membrane protein YdfJ with MMPL/SSD domain